MSIANQACDNATRKGRPPRVLEELQTWEDLQYSTEMTGVEIGTYDSEVH